MKWINLALCLISAILIIIISPFAYLFVIISILFSLAISIYTVYIKYVGSENAGAKTIKEAGTMVFTLIAVIFLGGIAGMLTNFQVGMRWGEVAGLISAIATSFVVGYLVRKGMGVIL